MRRMLLTLAVCATASFALVGSAQAEGTSATGGPVVGAPGAPGVGHDPTYRADIYFEGSFTAETTAHFIKQTKTTGTWSFEGFCDAGTYVKETKGRLNMFNECTNQVYKLKKVAGVKPARYFGLVYEENGSGPWNGYEVELNKI